MTRDEEIIKGESEEIKIYFDEDGIAKEYDDTYDITIHCESKEDYDELLDRLNRCWIPVSEKLPEESDYVSCLPFYDGVVIWLTDKGIMGFGWYYNCTNNWADIDDIWSDKYGEVIAWMPLPEPYKQEAEDEN